MRLCWVLLLGVLIVSGTVRSGKTSNHGDSNDDKDNSGDGSGDGNDDNGSKGEDKDKEDDANDKDDDDDDGNGARFLIPMTPAVFFAGTVLRLIG